MPHLPEWADWLIAAAPLLTLLVIPRRHIDREPDNAIRHESAEGEPGSDEERQGRDELGLMA